MTPAKPPASMPMRRAIHGHAVSPRDGRRDLGDGDGPVLVDGGITHQAILAAAVDPARTS